MIPYPGELAGLTAALAWTIASFIWKRTEGHYEPLAMSFHKAWVAFVLMGTLLAFSQGQIFPWQATHKQMGLLALSGLIGLGVGDTFYFACLLRVGPRRALLMLLAAPVMSALLGVIVLGESMSPIRWAGMALTLAGIGMVHAGQPQQEGEAQACPPGKAASGILFGLLACLGMAVSSLFTKEILNEGLHPFQAVQLRLVAVVLVLPVVGLATGRLGRWVKPLGSRDILMLTLFAGFLGTFVGITMMTISQKLIPIGMANTLCSTSPLFALPIAFFLRRSRIGKREVAGTVAAFAGVAMIFLFP